MSLERNRSRTRPTSVRYEEEKAWVGFYQRVRRDPAIALELLSQLNADVEMKRLHPALYMCCLESIRVSKAREARNQRIGAFVRWVFYGVFIQMPRALRRALDHGGDVAAACLPDRREESAPQQAPSPAQRLSGIETRVPVRSSEATMAVGKRTPKNNGRDTSA